MKEKIWGLFLSFINCPKAECENIYNTYTHLLSFSSLHSYTFHCDYITDFNILFNVDFQNQP